MTRSSFAQNSGKLVTIIGGSGFIGRHLVQRLARDGWRIRVAVRRPNEVPEMRVGGDVGQIQIVQANVRFADSVTRAVEGSDVVINLAGLRYQVGKQKFRSVHVDGARNVAEAAAAAGVSRLVHLSALAADEASPSLLAQTKAEGDDEVRAAFPGVTILRPSMVFGPDDMFLNKFATLVRMTLVVPLIGFGKTKFQPLYVNDLIDAFVSVLGNDATAGRVYELGGPEEVSFDGLVRELASQMNRPRIFVPWPFWATRINAYFFQMVRLIRIRPLMTVDQVRMLETDNVVQGGEGVGSLADLGVTNPVAISALLPTYMTRFRKHGQFDERPTAEA